MEHSSSSALLYLSHWLYLCTYNVYIMIKYNKPEPQLKRGICSFTSCVVTRSFSKAASGLPLELAFQKHHVISLGGLVEPEPLPCLLIGINATVSFGDLADLNHRYTYWELGRVRPW